MNMNTETKTRESEKNEKIPIKSDCVRLKSNMVDVPYNAVTAWGDSFSGIIIS